MELVRRAGPQIQYVFDLLKIATPPRPIALLQATETLDLQLRQPHHLLERTRKGTLNHMDGLTTWAIPLSRTDGRE